MNDVCGTALLAGSSLAAGAMIGFMFSEWKNRNCQKEFFPVGFVSGIYIYPVKSCRGIGVNVAECTPLGLQESPCFRDRSFMIVDESGVFLTASLEPKLLLIRPNIEGHVLRLTHPENDCIEVCIPAVIERHKFMDCRIWRDSVSALDCGDEVANWLEAFLCRPGIRLVYYPWEISKRIPSEHLEWEQFKSSDRTIFGDITTCHILTEASIGDLNRRLPENCKVSHRHFRPNIVVRGSRPYEEDNWKEIRIGTDVLFRVTRPCTRCPTINIDPETGCRYRNNEPMRTLKFYRQLANPKFRRLEGDAPCFGQYLGLDVGGKIRLGDTVFATF